MKGIQEKKIQGILENVKPVGKILDVGSGPGFLGNFLESVYSVDIDIKNLKKVNGPKVRADGNQLPFRDESFSTVFCLDTIHLLDSTNEIMRVLKFGGRAVVSTYCNKYNKGEKLDELRTILREFYVEKEFYAGDIELDAVIVASKKIKTN